MTEDEITRAEESETELSVPAAEEEVSEAEVGSAPEFDENDPDAPKWYVVHTYSGYENKVSENLTKRILTQNMRDQIFQVLVPVEEEVSFSTDGNKKQKKRTIKRKLYPGYVLIQMKMNDRSWYVVRNTPGVTGFVSPGLKPVPLPHDEVERIKQLMGLSAPKKIKLELEIGQPVHILSGAFQNHTGRVIKVDPKSEKLTVNVEFCCREVKHTLEFGQVEKI
ncbi:MAG: transcription termination/antitermination protein NusG [Candidatus Bruticola sp.]